jgi:hypothetical protein
MFDNARINGFIVLFSKHLSVSLLVHTDCERRLLWTGIIYPYRC